MKKTLIYGHRGASGLVKYENTIEAFEKAIEVKADGIELDIRKTKDNIIIVNHNPDINGLIINEHTFDEIKKNAGYEVATLEETLIKTQGKIFLDIEFKEEGYEAQAIDLILKYRSVEEFHTRSFLEPVLKNIKAHNKDVFTILLLGRSEDPWYRSFVDVWPKKHLKKLNANGVSPNRLCTLFNYVKRLNKAGYPVSVWTVNTEEDMRKFIGFKADVIITNYPDKALKIRKEILGY